jgi:hypothetical protein
MQKGKERAEIVVVVVDAGLQVASLCSADGAKSIHGRLNKLRLARAATTPVKYHGLSSSNLSASVSYNRMPR